MEKIAPFIKILTLAFLIWTAGLILFYVQIFIQTPQDVDRTTDAIVVLTGGKNRIETGLALFAQGKASHLFVSGVHPGVQMHEITDKWQSDVAMPPCCITLGYDATTTHQNAQEVAAWLEDKTFFSIRLITSNFHMNRSLIELRHVLPDIEIIPHPIEQPNAQRSAPWFWYVSLKEYNKTLVRWAMIIALPPSGKDAHKDHN